MNLLKNINKTIHKNALVYFIIGLILFIFVYIFFSQILKLKEGFVWDDQSTKKFLLIEHTINPDKVFDVNMIQENQASQEELNYFNKNGIWPWSQKTIDLYTESINKNPYIRTLAKDSISYNRTIYNESAILRVLSYQTKEGQFLLNGVLVSNPSGNKFEELPDGFGRFPYNSGLLEQDKTQDIIRCNVKENNSKLERITYTGKGGIFGEQSSNVNSLNYNELENIIPGFTFLNEPCNPCGALNLSPDYSCPFQIKLKNDYSISNVWKYLWGI
jgi:lipopolysaccharide export LptBFGC system permease protein LptF